MSIAETFEETFGIATQPAETLAANYNCVEDVLAESDEALDEIDGVGPKTVEAIATVRESRDAPATPRDVDMSKTTSVVSRRPRDVQSTRTVKAIWERPVRDLYLAQADTGKWHIVSEKSEDNESRIRRYNALRETLCGREIFKKYPTEERCYEARDNMCERCKKSKEKGHLYHTVAQRGQAYLEKFQAAHGGRTPEQQKDYEEYKKAEEAAEKLFG